MPTPNNKGLKEVPTDEGFDIFGCQIPHNVVDFCKKFLKRHPRIISRNYGENLANLEGFTGVQLATTLENVMLENLKCGDITFDDVLGQSALLEDLKNVVPTKSE